MTTGERIKIIRKNYNFNQQQFADILCISQTHISKIENNNDFPSEKLLNLICAEFNVNYEWLKHGTGTMNDDSLPTQTINDCIAELRNFSVNNNSNLTNQLVQTIFKTTTIFEENKYFIEDSTFDDMLFLLNILTDIDKLLKYLKSEYQQYKNVPMSIEDGKNKCNEITQVKEAYIANIVNTINYLEKRIVAHAEFAANYIENECK
ncbi:MAG: helix-turn-helix transcriptional regulator [Oscillospiraceae bacterium]|nr:helix-turn-helix transcriptional regulator [Oscillospiraceae bacterium]